MRSTARHYALHSKPRAVIIGSGWAGFAIAKEFKRGGWDLTFVSPRNHMLFTPLLPAAAVGTLEFRSIAEPIKHSFPECHYELGEATTIDPVKKEVVVQTPEQGPNGGQQDVKTARIPYDVVVVAPGARNATYGVPGVEKHAFFMKSLTDARNVRKHVIRNIEAATFPGLSAKERRILLSTVVAGGGPTGIEFAAELHDLMTEDILKMYPELKPEISITVVEGRTILGMFDDSLRDYTMKKFARDRIKIRTGANVTEVLPHKVRLSDGDELEYGTLIWNTGLAPRPLIQQLDPAVWRKDKWGHLVVDEYMRVLRPAPVASDGADAASPSATSGTPALSPLPGVYCIGDAAHVVGCSYAATAQVAEQQGTYLGRYLQKAAKAAESAGSSAERVQAIIDYQPPRPFEYRHKGALAFLGSFRGISDFTKGAPIAPLQGKAISGPAAFFLCESGQACAGIQFRAGGRGRCLPCRHAGILIKHYFPTPAVLHADRSAYLTKLGSWRNRMQVPLDWLRTLLFGRDTTQF